MSWDKTILSASYNGVEFECIKTDDSFEFSNVAHSYPYANGANFEPMGREPRRIALQAVFYGDDYETRLKAFLAVFDVPGVYELVHPVFGPIKVVASRGTVSHSADQPDYCEVPLEFLEQSLKAPLFSRELPANKVARADKSIGNATEATTGPFERVIDAAKNIQKPSLLQQMGDAIDAMQKNVRALALPAYAVLDSVTTGLNYLTAPTAFIQDLRAGFDQRISALSGLSNSLPSVFGGLGKSIGINRPSNSDGSSSVTPANTYTTAAAQIRQPLVSNDLATATPSPSNAIYVQVQVQQTLAVAQVVSVLLEDEITTQTLTPLDVESICNDARSDIVNAIALWQAQYPDIRDSRPVTESLKEVALSVQLLGQSLISMRPPLIKRQVTQTCNLHLLAHFWYGDYTRADELLRLNPQILNPNTLIAGDVVMAYAE